jgi:hypothetical protein
LELESLWYKVLAVKFGIRNSLLDSEGSRTFSWWRDINSIGHGIAEGGVMWFGDNIVRKI